MLYCIVFHILRSHECVVCDLFIYLCNDILGLDYRYVIYWDSASQYKVDYELKIIMIKISELVLISFIMIKNPLVEK